MLLTLRTTHHPASDLSYLLEKNPSRTQVFDLSFGRAHVTYPELSEAGCTFALYVEVDPLDLRQKTKDRGDDGLFAQYVNDRPYAASSYLAVAIGAVLRSAMAARSRDRQALAETAIPLTATVSALPVRGQPTLPSQLFGPLGYDVEIEACPLDPQLPEWGDSAYVRLTLRGTTRLSALLTHLAVLIPVLDAAKHYWVGDDEVEKLLARGEGWLAQHPERELIARRYLKRSGHLTRAALERLGEIEQAPTDEGAGEVEAALERPKSLNETRLDTVMEALEALGADRVMDVGCGEGRLLSRLLRRRPPFASVGGMDVSTAALGRAAERLKLDRLPEAAAARIQLLHGSLVYGDARLRGHDVILAIEVIEHLEPFRLAAFERVVFGDAAPRAVIVTTPNAEHNVRYGLAAGVFRHADHRFEWTRAELRAWAEAVAARRGYAVTFRDVGEPDPEVGPPTQLAVFTKTLETTGTA